MEKIGKQKNGVRYFTSYAIVAHHFLPCNQTPLIRVFPYTLYRVLFYLFSHYLFSSNPFVPFKSDEWFSCNFGQSAISVFPFQRAIDCKISNEKFLIEATAVLIGGNKKRKGCPYRICCVIQLGKLFRHSFHYFSTTEFTYSMGHGQS